MTHLGQRGAFGCMPNKLQRKEPMSNQILISAGVAQIEPAKAERAGSGPAPGDQKGKI